MSTDWLGVIAISISLIAAFVSWMSWVHNRKVYGVDIVEINKTDYRDAKSLKSTQKLYKSEMNLLNHRLKHGRYTILKISDDQNKYLLVLGRLARYQNFIEKVFGN